MLGLANPLILMSIIADYVLMGTVLQWLWNITSPELFNLKELNYSQAIRLLLIATILFGSSGIWLNNDLLAGTSCRAFALSFPMGRTFLKMPGQQQPGGKFLHNYGTDIVTDDAAKSID